MNISFIDARFNAKLISIMGQLCSFLWTSKIVIQLLGASSLAVTGGSDLRCRGMCPQTPAIGSRSAIAMGPGPCAVINWPLKSPVLFGLWRYVFHKSFFYRNGWIDRTGSWRLPFVLFVHCTCYKKFYLQNNGRPTSIGVELWNDTNLLWTWKCCCDMSIVGMCCQYSVPQKWTFSPTNDRRRSRWHLQWPVYHTERPPLRIAQYSRYWL